MAELVGVAIGVAVTKALLLKIFTFTMNLFRRPIAASIQEGDVSLNKLRNILQTQFGKLSNKLDKLMLAPLHVAEENLHLAMVNLEHNSDGPLVRHHLLLAQENALHAFELAQTLEAKLSATRLRLLCSFHIYGFFSDNCNMTLLCEVLNMCFAQLLQCNEIQSTLREELDGRSMLQITAGMVTGGGQRAERLGIINSVVELRTQLTVITNLPFDITLKNGRIFKVEDDLKPYTFSIPSKLMYIGVSIRCVHIHGNFLYGGSNIRTLLGQGEIHVWDTTSMAVVNTIQTDGFVCSITSSEKYLIVVYGGVINSASGIAVYDFDVNMKKTTIVHQKARAGGRVGDLCVLDGIIYTSIDNKFMVYNLNTMSDVTPSLLEPVAQVQAVVPGMLVTTSASSGSGIIVYSLPSYSIRGRIVLQTWNLRGLFITSYFGRMLVSEGVLYISVTITDTAGKLFPCIYMYSAVDFRLIARRDGQEGGDCMQYMQVLNNRLYVGSSLLPNKVRCIDVWDIKTRLKVKTIQVDVPAISAMVVSNSRLYVASRDIQVVIV